MIVRLVRWLKHFSSSLSCDHSPSTADCLTHTKLTQRMFSAQAGQGPCVYCLLSALSLLYIHMEHVVQRGNTAVRIRNLLVKRDDSNGRALEF